MAEIFQAFNYMRAYIMMHDNNYDPVETELRVKRYKEIIKNVRTICSETIEKEKINAGQKFKIENNCSYVSVPLNVYTPMNLKIKKNRSNAQKLEIEKNRSYARKLEIEKNRSNARKLEIVKKCSGSSVSLTLYRDKRFHNVYKIECKRKILTNFWSRVFIIDGLDKDIKNRIKSYLHTKDINYKTKLNVITFKDYRTTSELMQICLEAYLMDTLIQTAEQKTMITTVAEAAFKAAIKTSGQNTMSRY